MKSVSVLKLSLMGALLLLPLAGLARLGESNVAIAKRYGPVQLRKDLGTNTWSGVYFFKDYQIIALFRTNVCVMEMVSPVEDCKFDQVEVLALRDAIGGAGKWVLQKESKLTDTSWLNTSNRTVAIWSAPLFKKPTLMVMPISEISQAAEESDVENSQKAKGF